MREMIIIYVRILFNRSISKRVDYTTNHSRVISHTTAEGEFDIIVLFNIRASPYAVHNMFSSNVNSSIFLREQRLYT